MACKKEVHCMKRITRSELFRLKSDLAYFSEAKRMLEAKRNHHLRLIRIVKMEIEQLEKDWNELEEERMLFEKNARELSIVYPLEKFMEEESYAINIIMGKKKMHGRFFTDFFGGCTRKNKTVFGAPQNYELCARKFSEIIDLEIKIHSKIRFGNFLEMELRKTNSRINALEQIFLPELLKEIVFLEEALEEEEREEIAVKKVLIERLVQP